MAGEGSVYQRKSDGRWVAALSIGRREDRVIYRRYAASKTAARAALDDLRSGLSQPTSTTTVGDFLERWVNDARDIRPATRHGYRAVVVHHLTPRIGHIAIGSLTSLHVERLLADLEGRMSPKTARNVHVVLRRALGQAVRSSLVRTNVAAREYVDAPKVPQTEPEALTATQVRRLLVACKGDRLEGLFVLAVATGLRQGELLGLEWQDVDLEAGSVRVRQELVRRDGGYHLDPPKTDRSKRLVPFPAEVVEDMRAHRQRVIDAGYVPIATGPVFTNLSGGPLSGSWLTHHFYRLLVRAALPAQPFKILRATYASRLAEAGVSDVLIARLMGHSRTHTTKRHYIADRPEDVLAAVAKLVG